MRCVEKGNEIGKDIAPQLDTSEAQSSNYKYGTCPNCNGPFSIPGLTYSLCDACGWVSRGEKAQERYRERALDQPKDGKSSDMPVELENPDYS